MGMQQEHTSNQGCCGANQPKRCSIQARPKQNDMDNLNRNPNTSCRIIRIRKEDISGKIKDLDVEAKQQNKPRIPLGKPTSMSSLIIWNISKALELNPLMDLKGAIRAAKQRLESNTLDLSTLSPQNPEQQHLVCALLAWQQLGHHDADSLYKFVEPHTIEAKCRSRCADKSIKTIRESVKSTNVHRDPQASKVLFSKTSCEDGSFGSHTSGPVVKLPVETKFIMRCENHSPPRSECCKSPRRPEGDTMCKIDAACCLNSDCAERLAALDAATNELRSRACKLAHREAERVELLERAEAAWRDLEIGYQRRLALAEEKEEDVHRQIHKLVADRVEFKNACIELAQQLKDRGDAVEKVREELTEVEKQVCERACTRLRLSEEAAKGEATLAEQQCRVAQYERDLQFKEEQARRKVVTTENEADSARALTCEAERAMRAELSTLREQIAEVSKELILEDEANVQIKEEHAQLRQEKMEIVEDLEGCKVMCDLRMQTRVDELKKKKEMLNGVKEQALECRCKLPVDETVDVKRTPSLAAMCRCAPEDKLLESCSCTSLRSRLLSNLLADLFGGLQAELNGPGSQMPCQLLKCLEDKHDWDRASVIKTNLRNFFSKLLVGELDIAIATSIENYHAKWVGASCADTAKMIPDSDDDLKEGWEQRALEKRAQRMATQLAEQLFEEKAEQLAQRAKEIASSGPQPCECRPPKTETTTYPCLMPPHPPFGPSTLIVNRQTTEPTTPAFWKRTIHDVTQLRLQIEDLKKDTIKKEDLKIMEEKIFDIVKQAAVLENKDSPSTIKDTLNLSREHIKKETKFLKTSRDVSPKTSHQNRSGNIRKKPFDSNIVCKKGLVNEKPTKQNKRQPHGQSYAVNLCLCGVQKNNKQNAQVNIDGKSTWKQKPLRDILPQSSIVKQTKPININIPSAELRSSFSKMSDTCNSNCKCFRKIPSNTSIDKLLQTLTKWKCDLANPQEKCIKHIKSSLSKYSKTAIKESMRISNQNNSKINLSVSTASNKEQVNESDIYRDTHKQYPNFTTPVTTESLYMGAVYLDKSNENCKCIPHIDSIKETSLEKHGYNNIPIKCINTDACKCKIFQKMQKDHKISQTDELYKSEIQSRQDQAVEAKDIPQSNKNLSKGIHSVNNQKGLKRRSDINDGSQKAELFSSNYFIKFLGVTLDESSTNKNAKGILKDGEQNIKESLTPRDKYIERRRILQKNICGEPLTGQRNDRFGYSDRTTCVCHAKFEEFKSFMSNFFGNKIQDKTNTVEDLDSQNLKNIENTIESCVYCNSYNADDSKELEVNAFHLLEDHLKEKLEEFKSFTCKSACISPEEEEKLFSAILKRVKQVISDCANEMKCGCTGGLSNDGSWNRAYGLLQEYLKIKIKRVQCLCVLNDNKDIVLPHILDKVCNLIENDFQRLKEICKCKNSIDGRKKIVRIEDLTSSGELPEKDTNASRATYNDVGLQNYPVVAKLSRQNSNHCITYKENISSQVPPNLGMEAKSCDLIYNKNAQTTETDVIITNSKSHGVMYNKCDCCYNTDKINIHTFPDMFRTKEVLANLYTDEIINTIDLDRGQSVCVSVGKGDVKPIPKINLSTNDILKLDNNNSVIDERKSHVPYIGFTVDCSCDVALGSCVCMKSVVRANNNKIDCLWKEFLSKNNNSQNYSYIMPGSQYNSNDDAVKCHTRTNVDGKFISDTERKIQDGDKLTHETEVSVQNEDGMLLKYSLQNVNSVHNAGNTFDENLSLDTSYCNSENPLQWFDCSLPINAGVNALKLANSIYFPAPPRDNYYKSSVSGAVTEGNSQITSQDCECDKVPICHVKMLVQNIEKNLMESKCTCDSLISKVCPIHSRRVC